jgi:hypothetical protein
MPLSVAGARADVEKARAGASGNLLLQRAEAETGQDAAADGRGADAAQHDGGRRRPGRADAGGRSVPFGESPDEILDEDGLRRIVQRRAPVYDKGQDGHYNLISALHKAVRGSDPDAALYYLARMFDAGEDPLYLGRRLVRMASEDIGLPIRRRFPSRWPPRTPMIISVRPRANWRLRRPASIWRLRRNRMPPTWLSRHRCMRQRNSVRCCRRSTFSMRRPS